MKKLVLYVYVLKFVLHISHTLSGRLHSSIVSYWERRDTLL